MWNPLKSSNENNFNYGRNSSSNNFTYECVKKENNNIMISDIGKRFKGRNKWFNFWLKGRYFNFREKSCQSERLDW